MGLDERREHNLLGLASYASDCSQDGGYELRSIDSLKYKDTALGSRTPSHVEAHSGSEAGNLSKLLYFVLNATGEKHLLTMHVNCSWGYW